MPRPKTVSDEDVLAAALEVLATHGTNFTLTELARHVGLSRATLIQRFGDRDAILLKLAQREVSMTRAWLNGLPIENGPDGLWRFLTRIVESMGTGDGFSVRVLIASLEAADPALRALAGERYGLVQDAIAARLPDDPRRHETARHLHAVIAGAAMQWVATNRSMGLSAFVLHRLRWSLEKQSN
ncbi:macrolide 2'-phosphotransferase [Mesorhizobium huakuii]|uniref:TetR/AcrR family transcriptional regulator n=1 Tax=Mesorhizobium huakuii TaxID=28104 RepID=UPI00235D626D|nr:helix-turn-helix domain-containing protein [Mesorhizobium huakuii]GLQ78891.1 macrolide 2'-phosphotransferase [Mesorhizobium huakuii]